MHPVTDGRFWITSDFWTQRPDTKTASRLSEKTHKQLKERAGRGIVQPTGKPSSRKTGYGRRDPLHNLSLAAPAPLVNFPGGGQTLDATRPSIEVDIDR